MSNKKLPENATKVEGAELARRGRSDISTAAQIAVDIVAHRAVVNRGVQAIVLPRRTQVGIEHERHDELLSQRVLLGIHAMVGKDLKTIDDNTIGMAQVVKAHMGHRRRSGDIAPATTGELGSLSLSCESDVSISFST